MLTYGERYTFQCVTGVGGQVELLSSTDGTPFTVSASTARVLAEAGLIEYSNGAAAAIWTPPVPSDLSGLQAWWKADSLALTDGAAVASWSDSSGNSRSAAQGTAGARPVYKTSILNGKPVVRFDGVDDNLPFTASSLTSVTAFVVCAPSGGTAYNGPLGWGGLPPNHGFALVSADGSPATWRPHIVAYASSGLEPLNKTTASASVAKPVASKIYTYTSDQAAASIRTNGVDPGVVNVTSGFTQHAAIGYGYGFFGGDIAEIAVYNRILTVPERVLVESYLATKYGLTLG